MYGAYLFEYFTVKKSLGYKWIYNFFNKKWFIDRLYTEFIVQNIMQSSFNFFYKDIDRGLLEKAGPSGIVDFIYILINKTRYIQSGFVLKYLSFFMWAFLFILIVLYKIVL